MSIQNLSKDVLEQLECPVCTEYMLPPITLCSNGHNICSSCKQKLQNCPTCREPLSDTRNMALEKLALRVERPCHNTPHGCTLTLPIDLKNKHQGACEYNSLVCPIRNLDHCNWKGVLRDVKGHVIQKHRHLVTDISGKKVFCIKDFNKDIAYVHVILLKDDMFHQRFEVLDTTVHFVVRYIGSAEKASKFKQKFKLGRSLDKISVCNVVSSFSVDVQEIYKTGRCVKLHYDTIERFLDENNTLKFSVKVSKI